MRALWSLPKAAPALLRHLAAYAELAALDIVRARREIGASLIASAIAAICLLFCLFLGCLAVIAHFWDTDYRVASIVWLACGFLLVAVILLVLRGRLSRNRAPFLSDLQRQWQDDRVLLERIFAADEE